MKQELAEMIENEQISVTEIVDFIKTLKKLGKNNVMDKRNVKLVIDHFGLKKKKGWLKLGNGEKVKL